MYKALVSFSGAISMAEDEIREISDKKIAKDLLSAGYIVSVNPTPKSTPKRRTRKTKGGGTKC